MKSMTGYGRGEATTEGLRCTVEVSSVNRRQSDVDVRMPREFSMLEGDVRRMVAAIASRGRVQVGITFEDTRASSAALKVDHALADQYVREAQKLWLRLTAEETAAEDEESSTQRGPIIKLADKLGLMGADPSENGIGDLLTADVLFRLPGVFTLADNRTRTADEVRPVMEEALRTALQSWDEARLREGAHLKADLLARLAAVAEVLESVKTAAPLVVMNYRENLRRRLEEAGLPVPLEDERLLKEIALFGDKCDIAEEISRLGAHLEEFARLMNAPEPAGRALDFLAQEMNRELNTMGSKANQAGIAHQVVTGKTEVERIREQVQNAE